MCNTQRGLAGNGRMEMVPGDSGDLQRCLFLFNERGWGVGVGWILKVMKLFVLKKSRS